ncbi:MAG TPA: VWA domain-containing protein [Terriglobia bacterium]|nr:VWA domain-containing protein [Terriglobia bacterium]
MDARGRVSRRLTTRLLYLLFLPWLAGLAAGRAQDPHPAAAGAEIASHDNEPSFKLQVQRNLVVVRVVVRDAAGNPVGNLHKEDFRLLDNGKPQTILNFAVQSPLSKPAAKPVAPDSATLTTEPGSAPVTFTPLRYLALYFDDVHADFEGLARTRDAAGRYLASAIRPGDRIGVFTSSGQGIEDFTDNLPKIRHALSLLQPRPIRITEPNPCPDIFPYQAFLIVDRRDAPSLESATEETLICRYKGDRRFYNDAQQISETTAVQVMTRDESQSEYSFRELDQLVRRMGVMPGQRDIIFLSPGFMTENEKYRIGQIVDRALRSKVVINTFDSKGLFAPVPLGDATQEVTVTPDRPDLVAQKTQNQLSSYQYDLDVLSQLAGDTGGVFFHNSNDYDLGFRKVGTLVETYYVMTFSPQNLKPDGHFHTLKVRLDVPQHYAVQARRGYFAPRKSDDAVDQEKEDLREAVFSQDELSGLPIDVHTQFFKVNERDAKLSIFAHLDLRVLRFRKEQGRNANNVTFVTALFDRDGKYVTSQEKRVEFHLLDSSLERLAKSGITTKASFDVPPGTYLVREVVRDTEGGQMSGLNRTVEIPF